MKVNFLRVLALTTLSIMVVFNSPMQTSAEDNTPGSAKTNNLDLSDISAEDLKAIPENPNLAYADEFEPMNRMFFRTHLVIDNLFLKPASEIYRLTVPKWGRNRVANFMDNLFEPVSFFNYILQGDMDKAGVNLGRFLTNTILGLGGLFDIASTTEELQPSWTDFGLTLKKYGVNSGPYLFIPIIGPSSIRDFPSLGMDILMDPFTYVLTTDASLVRYGVTLLSDRERKIRVIDQLEDISLDQYATIRSIYLQRR